MTVTPPSSLLNHPAFAELTKGVSRCFNKLLWLSSSASAKRFAARDGAESNSDPESGRARLLGRQHGKLCTLALLGEEVLALPPCFGLRVVKRLQLQRLCGPWPSPMQPCCSFGKTTPAFGNGATTPSSCRIGGAHRENPYRSERATYGLQDVLMQCVGHAQPVPANPKERTNDLKDQTLFVASANSPKEIGDVLGSNNPLLGRRGPGTKADQPANGLVDALNQVEPSKPTGAEYPGKPAGESQGTTTADMRELPAASI